MFWNRKRKTADQESLVPHGLIWHATAEPETSEQDCPPPPEFAESTDLIPRREAQSCQESSREKLSYIVLSPELLNTPSTVSTTSQNQRETSLPPVVAENPSALIQRPDDQPRSSFLTNPAFAVVMIWNRRVTSRSTAWLHSSGARVGGLAVSAYTAIRNSWSLAWQDVDLRTELREVRQLLTRFVRNGVSRVQSISRALLAALITPTRGWIAQAQRHAAKAHDIYHPKLSRTTQDLSRRSSSLPRVRIVLTGLPLRIRILFARKLSEWRVRPESAGDDRLRTSMALAALCAIAALVIISLAPHYASRSLPSRLFSSPSTVSASTGTADDAGVQNRGASGTHAKPAGTQKHAPGKKKASAQTARPVLQPKPQTQAEEDYVAPDTYRYYGQASR